MTAAIAVEDLWYRYPGSTDPVVRGMSFSVEPGEVLGFLGPSGAGKTTTQRILIGLLPGWSGTVELFGRRRQDWGAELFDRIGVSFELPVGYPRLSVREDLDHFAGLHRVPCLAADEVLELVGLGDAADRRVAELSKGMRIRLNMARALLHQPELLFLDEPTSGLDPVNARQIREIVTERTRAGQTVFLTTHDMPTAAAVCDRVAFVVGGTIVALDTPRALELAHGAREIGVEYRQGGELHRAVFPLGRADPGLVALLDSGVVETIHTLEADLDDVFVSVTGHSL
jgi:fluoroquinolone transport system ATP-binding protein